jgi:phage regulator Rha-like protein
MLRTIENLECSPAFTERNFALSDYQSTQNKPMPMFGMTEAGLSFPAMGFTGAREGGTGCSSGRYRATGARRVVS